MEEVELCMRVLSNLGTMVMLLLMRQPGAGTVNPLDIGMLRNHVAVDAAETKA